MERDLGSEGDSEVGCAQLGCGVHHAQGHMLKCSAFYQVHVLYETCATDRKEGRKEGRKEAFLYWAGFDQGGIPFGQSTAQESLCSGGVCALPGVRVELVGSGGVHHWHCQSFKAAANVVLLSVLSVCPA
eukprot:1157474-Pelagomonas_calceolata.AAC.4